MLSEDEHGTEFKFSEDMPDTLGHSGTIGKIKAAIGDDRDRIVVDAADAFMHTPLKTNENIADFFTKFQPVATFRTHRDILMGICQVKRA